MAEFFAALTEQAFLRQALLAGLLASLGCGLIGPFVVVKRISSVSGSTASGPLPAEPSSKRSTPAAPVPR